MVLYFRLGFLTSGFVRRTYLYEFLSIACAFPRGFNKLTNATIDDEIYARQQDPEHPAR